MSLIEKEYVSSVCEWVRMILIIDAAQDVVMGSWVSHLTLNAVVAKAGVSKGRLIHHFPSKNALLRATIERQTEVFDEARRQILEQLPKGSSCEPKSFIIAPTSRNRYLDRLGASLSAAVAHSPNLNEPIRKAVDEPYTKLAVTDIPFEKTIVMPLAAQALWLYDILSLSSFTESSVQKSSRSCWGFATRF